MTGVEEGIAPADLAPLVGIDADGVEAAYDEIQRVRKATRLPALERPHHRHRRSNHPAGR